MKSRFSQISTDTLEIPAENIHLPLFLKQIQYLPYIYRPDVEEDIVLAKTSSLTKVRF